MVLRLWRACSSAGQFECTTTLAGHSGRIFFAAFSPDDRYVASASSDGSIRVWNTATGECKHTFTGHEADVRAVAWHPNSRTLASCGNDKTIKLWSLDEGECTATMADHTAPVVCLAWSPKGTRCGDEPGERLLSGSEDNTIRVWNGESGELLRTLEGHTAAVVALTWSPDSQSFASGSVDNTARVWSASLADSTFNIAHTFNRDSGVCDVAFEPSGARLAVSSGSTVSLFDAVSGSALADHAQLDGIVLSGSWSPSGSMVAAGSSSGRVTVWAPPRLG